MSNDVPETRNIPSDPVAKAELPVTPESPEPQAVSGEMETPAAAPEAALSAPEPSPAQPPAPAAEAEAPAVDGEQPADVTEPSTAEAAASGIEPAVSAAERAPTDEVPAQLSEFEQMLRDYEKDAPEARKGEIVQGRVVKIQEDNVLVDVGTRCEGVVPIEEIKDSQGNLKFAEGDAIPVKILSHTGSDFAVRLSHLDALRQVLFHELRGAYTDGSPVDGEVMSSVKGGMKVDLGGAEAFLPASQIDLRYVENTDDFIGLKGRFRIIKFSPRQGRIVVSRRVLLEEERASKRETIWSQLQLNTPVKGTVSRLTGYGVFVDLGGVEGLIHISNLSWDKVKKPSEMVKPGQEIEALVIELDEERGRIGLGLKQMMTDPWLTVGDRFFVDQVVQGRVEKLESFGAFVKLEAGITALIPISEMSWTHRVNHPSEVIARGDEITARILKVDPVERKISLSLKRVEPSPFQRFVDDNPVGSVVEGEVTNVVPYGAFVKLADGIEGLLHITALAGGPVRSIEERIHTGDKLQVKIKDINVDEGRISLSERFGETAEQATPTDYPSQMMEEGRGGRRESGPRRSARRTSRRDQDNDGYILDEIPIASTKLGELFPRHLLDKIRARRNE